jgi:signal transduction histidine kinase
MDYSHELPKEKIDTYLQIIVGESNRISRLINQVLDIEKIQVEAQQAPMMEPVSVENLVQTVLTGMEQLFLEKKIQLEYEKRGDQWQVLGNPDRLTQVIINLLSNAIKFCAPTEGVIQVVLTDQDNLMELRVKDNGNGIPAEAQELIFGQFTQLKQGAQDKPQGTGLGLYITRQIVQQHGGRIFVESALGEGACFVLHLPKI